MYLSKYIFFLTHSSFQLLVDSCRRLLLRHYICSATLYVTCFWQNSNLINLIRLTSNNSNIILNINTITLHQNWAKIMLIWWTKMTGDKTRMSATFCSQQIIPIESHWSFPRRISSYWPELHFTWVILVLIRTTFRISSCQPVLICIGSSSLFLVLLGSPSFAIWTVLILGGSLFNKLSTSGAFLFSMIRTHIRIAHIASIRTGSPVDSRQCDWGIIPRGPVSRRG